MRVSPGAANQLVRKLEEAIGAPHLCQIWLVVTLM